MGSALLAHCERQARAAGFGATALMATLPGRRLYARAGYAAGEPMRLALPGGVELELIPMRKALA